MATIGITGAEYGALDDGSNASIGAGTQNQSCIFL